MKNKIATLEKQIPKKSNNYVKSDFELDKANLMQSKNKDALWLLRECGTHLIFLDKESITYAKTIFNYFIKDDKEESKKIKIFLISDKVYKLNPQKIKKYFNTPEIVPNSCEIRKLK